MLIQKEIITTTELAKHLGVNRQHLTDKCKRLGFEMTKGKYLLDKFKVQQLIKKKTHRKYKSRKLNKFLTELDLQIDNSPRVEVEVIYVTRTIEIYESKLNYLDCV